MKSTDSPSACDEASRLSGILSSRHSAPAKVCWKLFPGVLRETTTYQVRSNRSQKFAGQEGVGMEGRTPTHPYGGQALAQPSR